MEKYIVIEHTADIGLKVLGNTKKELFINAARGMFFLITGLSLDKKPFKKQYLPVECSASGLEDLLVAWLNELLFIHNTDFLFLNEFKIECLTGNFLKSQVGGFRLKEFPCKINNEIKAVTYHNLNISKNNKKQWETSVIFDI